MKYYLFLVLTFLFFAGCTSDSPLSDVEINDPSLISPVIEISRMRKDDGTIIKQSITAYIYDKNNNTVQLKKGNVYMNGIKLELKDLLFSSGRYYSVPHNSVDIQPNKYYQFSIYLNEQTSRNAHISTQNKDLNFLVAPNNHNKNEDLNIQWLQIDPHQPLLLELGILYREDNEDRYKELKINIPSVNLAAGSFNISKDYFLLYNDTRKVRIKLSSIKKGFVDLSFRSGSISSEFTISKDVTIQ